MLLALSVLGDFAAISEKEPLIRREKQAFWHEKLIRP
jgi:hypothetical protein